MRPNVSAPVGSRIAPISLTSAQRRAAVAKLEGADAALTGLTRSLGRRLLGLNLRTHMAKLETEAFAAELPNRRVA